MAYVQYLEHVQSHEARSFHNRFKTISLLTRKPNSSCYVLLRQPVALRVLCHDPLPPKNEEALSTVRTTPLVLPVPAEVEVSAVQR
jgi:hypothetical protein